MLPRPFAKPHAKRQQRRLAELFNGGQMAGLARDMADQAMIERRRIGGLEKSGSGRRHITVNQHGNTLHAGGEDGAGNRRDLASAKTAHDFQRIGQVVLVEFHGSFHRRDLAGHDLTFRAGARTGPLFCRAAIKREIDRRRNGGVADAHFADAEKIGAAGNRLHTEGHGRGAVAPESAGSQVMSPVG